ncbi:MAG: AAA family ATPase [Vampirovibrionia bacterium]
MTKNNTENALSQIDILIRSRYPLIYITTWEEERVFNSLKRLIDAYKQKRKVYSWSVTEGLCLQDGMNKSQEMDLMQALDYIVKTDEVAIYILKDVHAFFDDPKIVRKFRDVYNISRKTYKNVICLSPQFKIPDELIKEVAVVDFPLPTLKELDQKLTEIIQGVQVNPNVVIDITPEVKEQILKAALGLTLNEAEHVFAKSIVKDKRLDEADIQEVLFEKQQNIRKTGILEYCNVTEKMDEIGGLENLKEWLVKRSKAFTFKAKQFGLPFPKGVMLLGVQGCGKSLCAKAMASIWQMPLLRLDVGRVFSSYMGSSEENIRTVIKLSESVAPCILWIDEVEKAFAGVKSSGSSDGGTTSRVFGAFITWLQEKTSPVFVIATANDISSLPPEFLRKGRFDEIFFVDLPNETEIEKIFQIHLKKYKNPQLAQLPLQHLIEKARGFSGAEIEQAVIAALFDAFDTETNLSLEHVVKSIEQTVPLSRTMGEEIEKLRRWAKFRARPSSLSLLSPQEDDLFS